LSNADIGAENPPEATWVLPANLMSVSSFLCPALPIPCCQFKIQEMDNYPCCCVLLHLSYSLPFDQKVCFSLYCYGCDQQDAARRYLPCISAFQSATFISSATKRSRSLGRPEVTCTQSKIVIILYQYNCINIHNIKTGERRGSW